MSWGKSKSNNNANLSFYVGEHVLLSGTGTRWGGGSFRATIEDIRADDDTVKVRIILIQLHTLLPLSPSHRHR